jgi:hypothetical protein
MERSRLWRKVQGNSLAGGVQVPAAAKGCIAGQFNCALAVSAELARHCWRRRMNSARVMR